MAGKRKDVSQEDVLTHQGGAKAAPGEYINPYDEAGTFHNPHLKKPCECREFRITERNEQMCIKCWPLPGQNPAKDWSTMMSELLVKRDAEEAVKAAKKRG